QLDFRRIKNPLERVLDIRFVINQQQLTHWRVRGAAKKAGNKNAAGDGGFVVLWAGGWKRGGSVAFLSCCYVCVRVLAAVSRGWGGRGWGGERGKMDGIEHQAEVSGVMQVRDWARENVEFCKKD